MLYRDFAADEFIASCRSWTRFRADAARLPPDRRDAAFLRLTRLLLVTAPLWRNAVDPDAIWTAAEVPADLRARLKLPPEGFDLLARTHDGHHWLVRTAMGAAPDAATFESVAFGRCRDVAHALIVHDGAEDIATGARTGQIGLAAWRALGQIGWKRILAAAKGRPLKRPAAKAPKPHQKRAVADAMAHFAAEERGRLVMPCGTGKSLAGFLIAEALSARTVIVAAPSLALIRQNLTGWAEESAARGRTFDCICVCSDETVAAGEDDAAESVSGLGVEVTTAVPELVARLRSRSRRPLVVFTTYHSSPLLADAASEAGFAFELAILDEAHKTVGAADRAFAVLLDGARIAVRRRLSMTATERVYRGEREDVLSMDDETVYGRCFHQLSFKAAVEQKLICDYRIITFFVGEGEIRELIEKNATLRVGHDGREALSEADAQSLAAGIALKRVIRDYGVRHTISFHRSIRAADRFRDQQDLLDHLDRRLGPRSVNLHVSGHFSAAARADIMDRFATAEIGCVSNAKCLTEGVDVPRTDCILFEGPKQSVIDIAQAAGRAMRLFPGKEYGYVLVPVVVPEGMSFDDFAATTQFRKVAQTLTAMSTQDERLAAEFRDLAAGRRPAGDGIVRLEGMGAAVGMEFATFADAVRAKVWRAMSRAHWRPYAEARDWARTLGLRNVKEWERFARTEARPADIPRGPDIAYADWTNWSDWLGTGRTVYARARVEPLKDGRVINTKPRGEVRPFPEARAFVHSLGLKNVRQWKEFARSDRMPSDIPSAADRVYADEGWVNWGDWLGTGSVADKNRTKRPFEEARAFVRGLGLTKVKQWREYVNSGRKPDDIPSHPEKTYAGKGWAGEADWIGVGPKSKEAPEVVRAIEGAVPEIKALREEGIGWPAIAEALAAQGVVLTPERLAALIRRLDAKSGKPAAEPPDPERDAALLEAGPAIMAENFRFPCGGQMMLSRLVARHLDWFDAAERRGMSWRAMAEVLTAAGITARNGKPLSGGLLSATVWKKRAGRCRRT